MRTPLLLQPPPPPKKKKKKKKKERGSCFNLIRIHARAWLSLAVRLSARVRVFLSVFLLLSS